MQENRVAKLQDYVLGNSKIPVDLMFVRHENNSVNQMGPPIFSRYSTTSSVQLRENLSCAFEDLAKCDELRLLLSQSVSMIL